MSSRYYIYSYDQRWLVLLASVFNLHFKKIIGYAFGKKMTNNLVAKTLKNAYYSQRPNKNKLLIFHTDLGSQYTSNEWKDSIQALSYGQPFLLNDCVILNSLHSSFKSLLLYWEPK